MSLELSFQAIRVTLIEIVYTPYILCTTTHDKVSSVSMTRLDDGATRFEKIIPPHKASLCLHSMVQIIQLSNLIYNASRNYGVRERSSGKVKKGVLRRITPLCSPRWKHVYSRCHYQIWTRGVTLTCSGGTAYWQRAARYRLS